MASKKGKRKGKKKSRSSSKKLRKSVPQKKAAIVYKKGQYVLSSASTGPQIRKNAEKVCHKRKLQLSTKKVSMCWRQAVQVLDIRFIRYCRHF